MDKTLKYRPFIKCRFCGKVCRQKSHKKKGTQYFCSKRCARLSIYKHTVEIECVVCGKKFECPIIHKNRKTCSAKCYDKYRGNLVIGKCKWCGKNVYGRQTANRNKEHLFCSKQCFGSYVTWSTEPLNYKKKKIWYNIKNGKKIECEICGIKDVEILTIHHKDNDRKNNDIKNLSLLCCNCHFKIHHNGSKDLKTYIKKVEKAYESSSIRKK